MKTITNIIYSVFVLFAFACFGLSPTARAQLPSPTPDGGYPNNNTAEGTNALFNVTTGGNDTAIGFQALFTNTAGHDNTATGNNALHQNSTGIQNTATGSDALYANTMGNNNVADGDSALGSNTTGSDNTALGHDALGTNTTGADNTAVGSNALTSNTTGGDNTAIGLDALFENTIGEDNTATGLEALELNTTGTSNTATGNQVLQFNTTGNFNTANGDLALMHNTTGSNNIALGSSAGINLTTGSNNIDIGAGGSAGEANTIRIGKSGTQQKTFIAGIFGKTVANGVGVIVGTTGQLGTVVSSARFKEAIKPMDKASEAILALKPVTFRYKKELDPDKIPQFGLIAEEVEKVNPDLVVRDEEGRPYSVRYDQVNAMLLNEFLKEHGKVEEQQATIAELKSTVAQQQKGMEALTTRLNQQNAKIQRVDAQLELNKSAPKTVLNDE
jgi:hypothetical protein